MALYDICKEITVLNGSDIGKISVLVMISIINLHLSAIEGTGPKSIPENRNKREG